MTKPPNHISGTVFVIGLVLILLVPLINVGSDIPTFMHPWRTELVSAIFLIGFSIWAFTKREFLRFVAGISSIEKYAILFPTALFIAWSGLSCLWSVSWASVLHHTTVWAVYLAIYVLTRYFFRDRYVRKLFLIGGFCFLAITCLPMLFEYYTYVIAENGTSIGIRYSKYTEIANVLLPIFAAFAVSSKRSRSILGIITVVMIGLFDIGSLSRTGIIVFVISFIAFVTAVFVLKPLRLYRKKAAVLFAVVATGIFVSNLLVASYSGNVPVMARINDQAATDSTNIRPFFGGIALEMWRENPITGIGADNFGQRFVEFRRSYAALNDSDQDLSLAEDILAERAHNEYLQILAELGIVGIALFAWLVAGILFCGIQLIRQKARASIFTYASFIGLAAFFVSSTVTSYSFRYVPNGVVFWVVLAVAVSGTLGRRSRIISSSNDPSLATVRATILLVVVSCIALTWFSIYRVRAVQYVLSADGLATLDERRPLIEKAITLDPENGAIQAFFGKLLLEDRNFGEAIPHLQKAIRLGRATSSDYSVLATAQILNNDRTAAKETLNESLRAYPYSVFLRVRLAVILKDVGQNAESNVEFTRAKKMNDGQAQTWWNYIDNGGVAASQLAFDNKLPPLMDLKPSNAIYAIKTERELRFPDEKFKLPMPNE